MANERITVLGDGGTDGGSITQVTPSRVFLLGKNPALEGDTYVVPGNPPRTGTLFHSRPPKVFIKGKPVMFEGDNTGTGGLLRSNTPTNVFRN